MRKSDITRIIREEVINIIRDQYLTEAFADPNLRKMDKMRGMDKQWDKFWKAFAKSHDIAWDKLPRGTLNKVSGAEQAKKGLAFWTIKAGEKENPFATDRTYSWDSTLTGPAVLAVTLDNKIQYFGSGGGVGSKTATTSTYHGTGTAVGLGTRGTLMIKKLKELADEIYVMDLESFRGGTTALKTRRAELKLGKDKFTDHRKWKEANLKRYKDILATRVGTRDQVDRMAAEATKLANEYITKGMEEGRIGKYGGISMDINGNEVKLENIANVQSYILRSYSEYIRYQNDNERDQKKYPDEAPSRYEAQAMKDKALEIKDYLNQLKSGKGRQMSW
jgi:hypothetical protein